MSSPSQAPSPQQQPPPDSDSGKPQPGASNLYLVTFLATLFLLLFISCAILLRSYILRRRFRRHSEGDFGAGLLLTPRSPGSRHTRFGHVPKLFDSLIINGGEKWRDMRPVAAQPVFVRRKRRDSVALLKPAATGQSTPSTVDSSSTPPPYDVRLLFSRFRRDTPTNSSDHIERPQALYPPSVPTPKSRVEMLQISTLIAMPSQERALRKDPLLDEDDDAPLPELVLGITKIPYRHKKLDPNSTSQPSCLPDIPTLPTS